MASDYQYLTKPGTYFGQSRREIAPLLPVECKRVLELGCASGQTMAWLRTIRHVQFAAGIELVPEAAVQAKASFDQIWVLNVETDGMPTEGMTFDTILALEVLEHLVDPWRVVERLHAVLAPGGCIIASVPNVSHYSVSLPLVMRSRWDYAEEGVLDQTHLRFFVESTAIALMSSSGMIVDKVDYVHRIPRRIPTRLGRWYFTKLCAASPLHHLIDFRILLRARASQSQETGGL